MSTSASVTRLHEPGTELRRARGSFVKDRMDDDGRSARFMATRIGISNTAFSDRLRGKAPFLADELEEIARTLKVDPVAFYRDYISVGPDGFEPTTSTVEYRRFDRHRRRVRPGRQVATQTPGWVAPVTPLKKAN